MIARKDCCFRRSIKSSTWATGRLPTRLIASLFILSGDMLRAQWTECAS